MAVSDRSSLPLLIITHNLETVLSHTNDSKSPDLLNLTATKPAHAPFHNLRHQNVAKSTLSQMLRLGIHIREKL
jgi:hypothetical protein